MLYRVIGLCIDLCTLCENNKKINDKKKVFIAVIVSKIFFLPNSLMHMFIVSLL